jgi:hypothetical protein
MTLKGVSSMKKQPQRHAVEVDFEGKTYRGTYSVSSGVVQVWFFAREGVEVGPVPYKPIGVHPDGGLLQARTILREILEGLKARGEL